MVSVVLPHRSFIHSLYFSNQFYMQIHVFNVWGTIPVCLLSRYIKLKKKINISNLQVSQNNTLY